MGNQFAPSTDSPPTDSDPDSPPSDGDPDSPREDECLLTWGSSSTESLQVGPYSASEDRRTLIKNINTSGYSGTVGQIRSKFGSKWFIGTATLLTTTRGAERRRYLLTAAHNFKKVHDGVELECKRSFFYFRQLDTEHYESKHRIIRWVVHPRYKNMGWWEGFDIAIAFFDDSTIPFDISQDSAFWGCPDWCLPETGISLHLWGYSDTGTLVEMTGTADRIRKTRAGGYLLSYMIQTSPGQSGSPVAMLISYNDLARRIQETEATRNWFVYRFSKLVGTRYIGPPDRHPDPTAIKKCIIGIHVAHSEEGYNFANILTRDDIEWIDQEAFST